MRRQGGAGEGLQCPPSSVGRQGGVRGCPQCPPHSAAGQERAVTHPESPWWGKSGQRAACGGRSTGTEGQAEGRRGECPGGSRQDTAPPSLPIPGGAGSEAAKRGSGG